MGRRLNWIARAAFARLPGAMLAAVLLAGAARPASAAGLTADHLLLIVNRNTPDSLAIARHYAGVRQVPEARILQLDVPFAENCTALEYEEKIAAPVRAYLASPEGRGVRCLVTFYGMPLRAGSTQSTPADREEVESLRRVMKELDQRTPAAADAIEAIAKKLQLPLRPTNLPGTVGARVRVAAAAEAIQAHLRAQPQAKQQEVAAELAEVQTTMMAMAGPALAAARRGPTTAASPPATQPAAGARAAEREQARRKVAKDNGPFALFQLIDFQIVHLSAEESDASVDSELALVQRPGYPRFRWLDNPLQNRLIVGPLTGLMVARIDASTPAIAMRIIDDAVETEKQGLEGRAAFDSRGIAGAKDGYGIFDQYLRDTVIALKAKTKLAITHDDRPALIAPHTARDVALYCGWYSVRQYIPSCDFVRGAVGYHVASFELISLRTPNEKGWVANLLRDNVCATLGAVSEPYLSAFPKPTEFFPLLLTGKLTLAECYWATTPMASWKMALIGDPLYKPYAARPQMAVSDLPEAQRRLVGDN